MCYDVLSFEAKGDLYYYLSYYQSGYVLKGQKSPGPNILTVA